MSNTLGALSYELGLDDRQLQKSLAEAQKKLEGLKFTMGIDPAALASMKELGRAATELDKINQTSAANYRAETARNSAVTRDAARVEAMEAESAARVEVIHNRGAAAISRASTAQKQLADSISMTNKTFLNQSTVASQLSTILGTTFSVYAIGSFIKQLATISGEFELQRVAMRAIIGDTEAADKIFQQVKELSVQSPFQFKDLLGFTKQLAAFSVPADQLFGTMSRLADVSSGLGIDMGRIILAYGQVRAATVLRGQELRQFTEAGIPLVDKLAEKFTKLEGRTVSAGEVFGKISEKLVPFKMIDEIFTDMTSSGGMFFEMQIKQSATLSGKISNLVDSYQIMMNSIGESNSGVLKGGVDMITTLMNNWQSISDVLKVVIASYGTYRLATIANNIIFASEIALEKAKIIVLEEAAAANVTLSAAQLERVAAEKAATLGMAEASAAANVIPWVALATVIVGLGVAFYQVYTKAHELQNALDDIIKKEAETTQSSLLKMRDLTDKLKEANMYSADRAAIIKELNNSYGAYLENVIKEGDSYDEVTAKLSIATAGLYENAKAKALAAGAIKIQSEESASITSAEAESRKALVDTLGFTQSDASKLLAKMFSDIRNSPELIAQAGGLAQYMSKILGEKGVNLNTFSTKGTADALLFGLQEYKTAIDDASRATADLKLQTTSLGDPQAAEKNQPLIDSLEKINKYYKDIEIAINAKKRSDDSSETKRAINNELLKNEADRLNSAAAEYHKYGLEAQATSSRVQAASKDPSTSYAGNVSNQILQLKGFKQAYIDLAATIEANQPDEKINESFKNALDEKKKELAIYMQEGAITKSQKPVNYEADLKEQIKLYTKITEDITGVYDKNADKAASRSALSALEAQVDLIKAATQAYDDYKKSMGEAAAKSLVKEQFPTVSIYADKGLAEFQSLYEQASQISTEGGKKLTNKIALDIEKLKKEAYIAPMTQLGKDVAAFIESNKDKFDLFKTIKDITGDKKLAMTVSFGVDFQDTNVRDLMKQQIDNIASGMDYKLPKNLTGVSFESIFPTEQLKNLAPDLQASLKSAYDTLQKFDQESFSGLLSRAAELVKSYGSNEAKKLAITKEFDLKRTDLEATRSKIGEEEYGKTLKNIKAGEASAQAEVDGLILADTQIYKDLYSNMENYSMGKVKSIISAAQQIMDTKKATADPKKFFVTIDGKEVEISIMNLDKLAKKVQEVKDKIKQQDPFALISDGFKKIIAGGENSGTGFKEVEKGVKAILSDVLPLASAFENLGKATGDVGMEKFGKDMAAAIGFAEDLMDLTAGIASGDPEAILKSVVSVATKLINAEAQYQEAKRKWIADNIKMQNEYNNLLTAEQLLFVSGSTIFGTDKVGKVANAMNVYRNVLIQTKDEIGKLGDAMVSTGVRGDYAFGIRYSSHTTYDRLLKIFPDILTAEGKLNVERAKALLATDKLTEATRAELTQLVALDEQAKAAYDQMVSYLTDVFGSLGQSLSDSIVKAFSDGTDASLDFKSSVTNTIEKLTQDLMNSMFLADYFGNFQKQVVAIYSDPNLSKQQVGANVISTMSSFFEGLGVVEKNSEDFLAQMQSTGQKYGFDLYKPTTTTTSGLTADIKSVTEDTANLLSSLLNAVRGDVSAQVIVMKSIEGLMIDSNNSNANALAQLVKIESNTYNTMLALQSVITGRGVKGSQGITVWA